MTAGEIYRLRFDVIPAGRRRALPAGSLAVVVGVWEQDDLVDVEILGRAGNPVATVAVHPLRLESVGALTLIARAAKQPLQVRQQQAQS